MRPLRKFLCLSLTLLTAQVLVQAQQPPNPLLAPAPHAKQIHLKHVLVIGQTKGFEHDSVSAAMAAIYDMGKESGLWDTMLRTDTELLTKKDLQRNTKNLNYFDAVIFASTTGELDMDASQKQDLMSFIKEDPKNGEFVTHQFTLSQRNKDTKHDKYNNIRNAINDYQIGKATVKEIEESLSLCNSKTCDQADFLVYLENKNRVNSKLFNHYGQNVFRKLRFNSHINRRRSEDNMVNGFRKKMGFPEKIVVISFDLQLE